MKLVESSGVRGRPRIYKNDSEKKAAYRQRKLDRKLRAHERKTVTQPHSLVTQAGIALLAGDQELAATLVEQNESEGDTAQLRRPLKHHKSCRPNACLCDLPMSRGEFLRDAPRGCAKLVSGGFGPQEVGLMSDLIQELEECGGSEDTENTWPTHSAAHVVHTGRRVAAKGWSSTSDEDKDAKNRSPESDSTFMEKHFRDSSYLRCYFTWTEAGHTKRCTRLPWAVLPEDYDKPLDRRRYCCDLHTPLR
jgi:hypothetical protein